MINDQVIEKLNSLLGNGNLFLVENHAIRLSPIVSKLKGPIWIAHPGSTYEIQEVIKVASKNRIPIIPQGAGTGVNKIFLPSERGVVLSMARMNRILDVDTRDRVCVVEAGVVTMDLHREVKRHGLFYPVDPASMALSTMGGNVATNAGGPRAIKYGTTRDYLLGLDVVLGSGEVLQAGGRVIKNVTGYDLTRLFCGSRGSLGVIVKAIFKLLPEPDFRWRVLVGFRKLENAVDVLAKITSSGILPASVEIMDNSFIRIAEKELPFFLPLDAEVLLIVDMDGFEESVLTRARQVEQFCLDNNPLYIKVSSREVDMDPLWMVSMLSAKGIIERCRPVATEEVKVPLKHIPAVIRRMKAISEKHGILIISMAYGVDGTLHLFFCFDPDNEEEARRFQRALEDIIQISNQFGETLKTGHGTIFRGKNDLSLQISPEVKRILDSIKKSLDPEGIMNPLAPG